MTEATTTSVSESSKADNHKYWRSLAELENTPEFEEMLHREFPQAASEFPEGVSRRHWLKLMGASLALGGVAGCRWPKENIAPFAVRPAGRIPGVPEKFATTYVIAGLAEPLIATSYDGRPIKVDGNPLPSQFDGEEVTAALKAKLRDGKVGGSSVFAQASVLELYDPDRGQSVQQRDGGQAFERTWDDFAAAKKKGLGKIAVLAPPCHSLSLQRLRTRFLAANSGSRWFEYAPLQRTNELAGIKLAFGKALRPQLTLRDADVIVSVDCDLFAGHPTNERNTRDFAAGRAPKFKPGHADEATMNRLYVVESQFTTAGIASDHRLPLRTEQIGSFLVALEQRVDELLAGGKPAAKSSFDTDEKKRSKEAFFEALAADLVEHKGKCVLAIGEQQPAEVHAIGYRLNDKLAAIGKFVQFTDIPFVADATGSLAELSAEIGKYDTLVVLGGNPVYDAPADLKFAEIVQSCSRVIYHGLYENETAALAGWYLPAAHPLESWGDAVTYDGKICTAQPLIDPLYAGKTDVELIALLAGEADTDAKTISRATLAERRPELANDDIWRRVLHDGVLPQSLLSPVTPALSLADVKVSGDDWKSQAEPGSRLELVLTPSPTLYDGQYANLGWLQECPDPITKLTWDNAALISPQTARKLGVRQGKLIKLTLNGRTIEAPAYLQPGQAEGSIGLALGYGRTHAGIVGGDAATGVESPGVNAYLLRASEAPYGGSGLEVQATSTSYPLATTQDHHAIDTAGLEATYSRVGEIVREASLEQFREHPESVAKGHHSLPHDFKPLTQDLPWQKASYEGHAWGMAIDLGKCTGCNACVVACQAENNVPIVGKEQVIRGREMHWLRIDRYFKSGSENPQAVVQPMACVHCEAAPCETVCPVAATAHSPEGLNDMAYNRCIGTRYCANNCPYKVRRFNFLDFRLFKQQAHSGVTTLVNNPDVTVRNRGVMEKCTYCVQRIQNTKIKAKNEGRAIRDGEITTACQDACSADAIVFGDLQNPNSAVSKLHTKVNYNDLNGNDRAYQVLAELDNRPRTAHLVRIRNYNPLLEIEEAHHGGHEHGHDHKDDHKNGHGDHKNGDHKNGDHKNSDHKNGAVITTTSQRVTTVTHYCGGRRIRQRVGSYRLPFQMFDVTV